MPDPNLARWRDGEGRRRQRRFHSAGDARAYERAMRQRLEEERTFQAARKPRTNSQVKEVPNAPPAGGAAQSDAKNRERTQSDPRTTGGWVSEDETEASIRYCAEQYAAALAQAIAEPGTAHESAEQIARAAYKLALPTLTPSSARSYVACLAQGVHMGVYQPKEITALLYAAQLCMGPRR